MSQAQTKSHRYIGDSFNQTVLNWLIGIDENVNSSKLSMVGVLRTYCNSNSATRQLNDLIEVARASTPTARPNRRIPKKAVPRLAPDRVEKLIALYTQGDSIYQLARRFSIHRGTVKDHLYRAGVEIRPGAQSKLSESDKNEITKLYEKGLSIHKIALQFGVTDNPVHRALKERGVKMRDAHGRAPSQY